MVKDGAEYGPYDMMGGKPVYSKDGKHFAYAAEKDGKWSVIRDGVSV